MKATHLELLGHLVEAGGGCRKEVRVVESKRGDLLGVVGERGREQQLVKLHKQQHQPKVRRRVR
jgi:hypothetical protein